MPGWYITWLIVFGGIALFGLALVVIDEIGRRRDRRDSFRH